MASHFSGLGNHLTNSPSPLLSLKQLRFQYEIPYVQNEVKIL